MGLTEEQSCQRSFFVATALAGIVRGNEALEDGGGLLEEEDDGKRKGNDSADWWKRGEAPPF